MALKSTVLKVELAVNDLDRNYYQAHSLTLARHPSETDERIMVRVLAFALNAHGDLKFGRGLSDNEDADLWLKDLTGAIQIWIEVGQPDVKALRKAAGRADHVIVYSYGRASGLWWKQAQDDLERIDKLTIVQLTSVSSTALAALVQRNMALQCMIQDGEITLSNDDVSVHVKATTLK
jgi:uncharacterized protein YaeQ